jgi:uncharacterized protein YkwD
MTGTTLRRCFSFMLAALVLAGALAVAPANRTATAAGGCAVAEVVLDSEEAIFVRYLNEYRAQKGLGALRVSVHLSRSSEWLVRDMAANRYFAHQDRFGRDPSARARDCGYPGQAGENLAAGTDWDSGKEAFDAWRSSPGHNQNMLTSYYTMVGVARYFDAASPYGWYWATDFGIEDDGTTLKEGGGSPPPAPPPPPSPTPKPTQAPAPDTLGLRPGANLVSWPGPDRPPADALRDPAVEAVYSYNPYSGQWDRYIPGLPASLNTLPVLRQGQAYWMIARTGANLEVAP